jgi:hypothetical protein
MDKSIKRIIQAVAGSGKTTYLIDLLEDNGIPIAIITFTVVNHQVLNDKIREKFDGRIPDNIHIFTLFQFLYNFCLTPYLNEPPKGLNFDRVAYYNTAYQDSIGRFYKDRLSKYILEPSHDIPYLSRISRYFAKIYIDEVQDLTAYDLDWLLSLSQSTADILCVGDFYQKTFQSSNAGNKNKKANSDFSEYKKKFSSAGFSIDEITLIKSWRCSEETCNFVREKLGVVIESANPEHSKVPFLIEDENEISQIWNDSSIPKLFYRENYKFDCTNSLNWGESKGSTFSDICVILNLTIMKMLTNDNWADIKAETKAKFYVAMTRARGQVYFVDQTKINQYKK